MSAQSWIVPLVAAVGVHAAIGAIRLDPAPAAAPARTTIRLVPAVAAAPAPTPAPAEPASEVPPPAPSPAAPRSSQSAEPDSTNPPGPSRAAPQVFEDRPPARASAPEVRAILEAPPLPAELGASAPPPAPPSRDDAEALRTAYAEHVRRAIERHQRYPRRARTLGQEGVAVVELAIGADGRLLAVPELTGSSGAALLDREAARMAAAAAPLPAPPGARPIRIAVPVAFRLDARAPGPGAEDSAAK